jgi:hypothetical protein
MGNYRPSTTLDALAAAAASSSRTRRAPRVWKSTSESGARGVEVDAMIPHRLCPQCFCAGDLVEEIVKELKTRMKARGDTGQIKRAEQLLGEIQILKAQAQSTDAKLDAILKHLNIEAPPAV